MLLLYGKPTTRIAALRTADIHTTTGGEITLRLGRGKIPLPEPLSAIAHALRDQQLQRTGTDGWLLPRRPPRIEMPTDVPPRELAGRADRLL